MVAQGLPVPIYRFAGRGCDSQNFGYALKIDLVGVSSLYALAAACPATGLVVPLMDARHPAMFMLVFTKEVRHKLLMPTWPFQSLRKSGLRPRK